ncbi:MAG: hypothetical protein MJY59_01030 [Bacteroidaceae bacterium]|nr:hypothetical protein [Bacteroidaceae bacterium]
MDNKKLNRRIAVTATLLILVVGAELGFIVYIRYQNFARERQIEETRLEIAYEDSVNRATSATHAADESVSEHFGRRQEADPLDDYIDKMVEREIRALEEAEKRQDEDSTAAFVTDPELDENEDWESEGEVVDSVVAY